MFRTQMQRLIKKLHVLQRVAPVDTVVELNIVLDDVVVRAPLKDISIDVKGSKLILSGWTNTEEIKGDGKMITLVTSNKSAWVINPKHISSMVRDRGDQRTKVGLLNEEWQDVLETPMQIMQLIMQDAATEAVAQKPGFIQLTTRNSSKVLIKTEAILHVQENHMPGVNCTVMTDKHTYPVRESFSEIAKQLRSEGFIIAEETTN